MVLFERLEDFIFFFKLIYLFRMVSLSSIFIISGWLATLYLTLLSGMLSLLNDY